MVVSSSGRLVNVSVKVPEELRELMRRVKVDWSEYLREVIKAKIKEELKRRGEIITKTVLLGELGSFLKHS